MIESSWRIIIYLVNGFGGDRLEIEKGRLELEALVFGVCGCGERLTVMWECKYCTKGLKRRHWFYESLV